MVSVQPFSSGRTSHDLVTRNGSQRFEDYTGTSDGLLEDWSSSFR